MSTILLSIIIALTSFGLLFGFILFFQLNKQRSYLSHIEMRWTDLSAQLQALQETRLQDQRNFSDWKNQLQKEASEQRQNFDQHQLNSLRLLQDSVQQGMTGIGQHVTKLTDTVEQKLKEISGQVEKRLSDGFAQTTATFTDVIKRLALIDEAQKRITELSSSVVSLQAILADKRSRGVFGEVQLNALIHNVLPEAHFSLQHTLSNGKRADCVLFLPQPTGTIAIDAKFPLESYRRITDTSLSDNERHQAEAQFRIDIRKHIQDVASRYIVSNETAEGAVLFIPAEAVFAEIHAHYYDLVEEAHKARVWLASPTTMMAILTTARAVLKDAATREQIHIIQKHLGELAKDFGRFQTRMNNLARHIDQAHDDIQEVRTSAEKITSRFEKIEKVELEDNRLAVEM
jgi:DNA recombination protein RmuC